MKKLLYILLLPLLIQGCSVESDPVEVILTYTTTGDDNYEGQATTQDIRWLFEPITISNWSQATIVMGLPQPDSAGILDTIYVPNIPSDTVVYFAIVLCDEVGNCAGISNVAEKRTGDITSPAAVSDLKAL